MEELEKNHERVRNDLTSANFELERLKKAKEESEAAVSFMNILGITLRQIASF